MKLQSILVLATLAASVGLAYPAFAEDAHHPEKQAQAAPAKPAAPIPTPGKPTAVKPGQPVQKMQDNATKMMGQLDRIAKAKTDKERRKAITQHLITMQEQMQMARGMQAGMMDCPMMEGGMMGMMGQGAGMGMMGGMGDGPGAGGADRMQQMERRMDMMQMMMEQMLRRPEAPPAPAQK